MGAVSEIIAKLVSQSVAERIRFERTLAAQLITARQATKFLHQRSRNLHFIGGGPLQAIAMELALKSQEINYTPAHAYSIEQFLHGPITAVEAYDVVMLLPAFKLPEGRIWEHLYAQRLEACAKAADAIGAMVLRPYWDQGVADKATELSLSWQSLLHLVWGQDFCIQAAKFQEINPDRNRRDDSRYEDAFILGRF
jgi:fructoselysine-6-P-deglycase FrlB-like protein